MRIKQCGKIALAPPLFAQKSSGARIFTLPHRQSLHPLSATLASIRLTFLSLPLTADSPTISHRPDRRRHPEKDRPDEESHSESPLRCHQHRGRTADREDSHPRPEPDPKSAGGDWRCKVKLDGLGNKTFIYGVDALQALSLALKFVESELRAFTDAGWHFYLPGCPDHPVDMAACYFPQL